MNTKELWIEVKEILSRDESVSPEIYNYYISDTNLYTVSDNNCLITTKSGNCNWCFWSRIKWKN